MRRLKKMFLILTLIPILAACAVNVATVTPTLPAPTTDPAVVSNGRGEPRSGGYWLLWNACTPENKAEVAAANGGREAGWVIMDDLLASPGILVGGLTVETCDQGVNLLQAMNMGGVEMKNDAAYTLAAQLLTAQLNLAAGSEYCLASDQAVSDAQKLLLELNFNDTGSYLAPPRSDDYVEVAKKYTEQLINYNNGSLCVP